MVHALVMFRGWPLGRLMVQMAEVLPPTIQPLIPEFLVPSWLPGLLYRHRTGSAQALRQTRTGTSPTPKLSSSAAARRRWRVLSHPRQQLRAGDIPSPLPCMRTKSPEVRVRAAMTHRPSLPWRSFRSLALHQSSILRRMGNRKGLPYKADG
jgi:hypothetical protein